MTTHEKEQRIIEHCQHTLCIECELNDTCEECYGDVTPEIIDRNYNMIFGEDMEPTSNEVGESHDLDPIKPEYYNDSKITPFDVIDDWDLGFYLGNAIKYIKRAGKKKDNSRLQDLKKIREYIDQEIRKEEGS